MNERTPEAEDPTADDVPWLSDDQLAAWVAVLVLTTALPAALESQLKRDSDLTLFEYHVLTRLSATPEGSAPMSDLAQLAQGSPSRLSHAVARLERSGFVRRIACAEAGKRRAATLTHQGWELVRQAAPGHVREARRLVVDRLSAEQLALLAQAATSIVAAADPEMAATLALAVDNETARRRNEG